MKLSICIPTYNRRKQLLELLDSIVSQLSADILNDVEIVISDNCSQDETGSQITEYINDHQNINIVFHVNDTNLGADRNYIKSVELAKGDYAWIIGSDDKLCEGAVKRALDEIDEHCSVYFSNRVSYNVDFSLCSGIDYFYNKDLFDSKTIKFCSNDDWNNFFNLCESIGGICSYLSSFFFDRKMFLNANNYEDYIGTAYVHVYMLFRGLQLKEQPTIKIIKEPFVICRLGDDSFFINTYQRIMLDFEGYIKISDIFTNPIVRKNFLSVLRRTHTFFPVKMLITMNKKERTDFFNALLIAGYPMDYIELLSRISCRKILTTLLFADRIISSFCKK